MSFVAPGSSHGKTTQAICQLLSDRTGETDWEQFASQDWAELVKKAGEQGVAPVLHWKLNESKDLDLLPTGSMDQLRQAGKRLAVDYYRCAAQNQLLYAELGRILGALESAGVACILLKGAALGTSVYPDPALRPMNDLDLLVDRSALERGVDAIRELGYAVEFPEHLGMAGWVDEALNHHIHLVGGPTQKLVVELHWSLVAGEADWRSPDLEWFWRESMPVVIPNTGDREAARQAGNQAHILSPTATLLYQAAHLVLQHGTYRSILLWYYDLHLLVGKCQESIDWGKLPEIAGMLHWADATRTALLAIRALFHSSFPEKVIEGLEAYSEPRARRMIALTARATEQRTQDTWQGLQVYDPATRLRLILALIFPRPAYLRWRYNPSPAWLWPAYYPYRWVILGLDGLASLAHRSSGQPG